jgi:hypothetical protein
MWLEKVNYTTLVCDITTFMSCPFIYSIGCHVLHIKSWAAEVLGFSRPLLGLPWHKRAGAWTLLEITAGLWEFLPSTVGKCYCEQEIEIPNYRSWLNYITNFMHLFIITIQFKTSYVKNACDTQKLKLNPTCFGHTTIIRGWFRCLCNITYWRACLVILRCVAMLSVIQIVYTGWFRRNLHYFGKW